MDVMLTTKDNPYNPFTNYEEWLLFDNLHGHNTPGLIARLSLTFEGMSETELDAEFMRVIDDIIKYDPENKYIKVHESPK